MSTNPNKIISLQELINAQVDAYKLEQIMNEAAWVEITTRLGRKCYSILTINAIIEQYKQLANSEIANLTDAINVALAAGAGAAGWTDSVVATWSGRTQEEKNKDFVTDKDYGAIGDGLYHPLSEKYNSLDLAKLAYANIAEKITSLDQSIDWAAAQSAITDNKQVWIDSGYRIINDTIEIPAGHGFTALEKPATDANGNFISGTAFLFYGTGAKKYIAPTLGDEVYQITNPSVGAAYLGDSGTRGNIYKLRNFNENFSVAVLLNAGSYIDKLAVLCYHSVGGGNGVSGYSASNSGACADQWDVGVWARNCSHWKISNVFGRGQFRKAGLLISASQTEGAPNPVANDGWFVENSVFSGGAGLSIRSDNSAPAGFTNYGFGNGTFKNCQFFGFAHQSSHLATSSYLTAPLDRPSACIELNGIENKPRGIDFYSCTIFGRDDISIMSGYANEIKFFGCYQESKGLRVAGAWTANTEGSRMVVTADSSLQFIGHSKYGVDFTPNFQRDSGVNRYGAVDGCFAINSISSDDDYENFKYINSTGVRLRRSTGIWGVSDYQLNSIFSVDGDGDVTAARSITAGGIVSFKGGLENTVLGGATVFKRSDSAGVMYTYMWVSGTSVSVSFYGNITPNTDNAQTLGSTGSRWSTVYLGTAPVVTSDERLKQQFRSQSEREKAAALEIKNAICLYKFNDAVDLKGDGARWHVGVKAQQVISILEAHELEPFEYGFVCYDEWEDQDAIYDEDGNQQQLAQSAGSRYAIRYDELAMFLLSI
ncbi:tail fiber domain-containing protein [Acinetobacter guillouiae]|uniref:tail fiber domain-containing protein n=1 Tax=Acinetobacter guillouiae TaxID=106649 RepID=UPI003C70199C